MEKLMLLIVDESIEGPWSDMYSILEDVFAHTDGKTLQTWYKKNIVETIVDVHQATGLRGNNTSTKAKSVSTFSSTHASALEI